MMRDLRFAFRSFAKQPLGTGIMAIVAGIGLGAATAGLGVVDFALLRPLPYGDAQNVVSIWETSLQQGITREPTSAPNYVDWKAMNSSLSGLAAFSDWLPIANQETADEQLIGAQVTVEFFGLLRVSPIMGRLFDAQDVGPDAARVVILSQPEWIHRFGTASINQQTIRLGGAAYHVIGVAPANFRQPGPTPRNRPVQIWRPLTVKPAPTARRWDSLEVIGRLKPGVAVESSQREFDVISAGLAKQYPEANGAFTIKVTPVAHALAGPVRTPLLLLLSAVCVLLVITWMNFANVLAARSLDRQVEFAVRTALGATTWARFRLLLVECLLLVTVASAVAIVFAYGSLRVVALEAQRWIPGIESNSLGIRGVMFCLIMSLLIAPILSAVSLFVAQGGNERLGGRGIASQLGVSKLRSLLVASEISLTVVLLTTCGALLRDFRALEQVPLGFDTHDVITAQLQLPPLVKPVDPRDRRSGAFLRDLVANVAQIPGVEMAAGVDSPPFLNRGTSLEFVVEGMPLPPPDRIQTAETHLVTPGYFRLAKVALLSGRTFDQRDGLDGPYAILINQFCGTHFFNGSDPVGRRVAMKVPSGLGPWRTVVGVVGDIRHLTITGAPDCQIYMPHEQEAWPSMALLVKTAMDPASIGPSLYAAIRKMDPTRPLYNIRTEADLRRQALASRRFSLSIAFMIGAVSLLVALTGVYGMVSLSVTRRTREVGVRVSVGADPAHVIYLFISGSLKIAAAGLVGGLLLTAGAARPVQSVLEGVKSFDPLIYCLVSGLIFTCVALASYIPARRAASIDPIAALRHE